MHALGLAAVQRDPTSGAGARSQHNSLEAAPFQFLQRNVPIPAHAGIAAEDNAQGLKARHLRRHNGIGQAIGRNTVAQHAAGEGSRFKDRHRIAQLRQKPRARQARRTGTNNGDLCNMATLRLFGRHLRGPVAEHLFHPVDIDRRIHSRAGAAGFARMEADPPGNGRERLSLHIKTRGPIKIALLYPVMRAADIDACRAGRHTGRHLLLHGIQTENVKRTGLCATAAAGAGSGVDALNHAVRSFRSMCRWG